MVGGINMMICLLPDHSLLYCGEVYACIYGDLVGVAEECGPKVQAVHVVGAGLNAIQFELGCIVQTALSRRRKWCAVVCVFLQAPGVL